MPRNLTDALVGVLDDVMTRGELVVARGQEQLEVRGHMQTIDRPQERVLILPGRTNNIFAQVAETIWVLAGRDDMSYLSRYLPRAGDFSDDGETWRAAYGPRLRRWGGYTDQLSAVVERFAQDPYTKRAVISIFDPGSDFGDSLDVPCNNWLHFLQRDNRLHLSVAVRANDAIWGFSGINVFEWSVLQEVIAASLGIEAGELNWFVGSMHVYERHYAVARHILRNRDPRSPYEFGVPALTIRTAVQNLDEQLAGVLQVEAEARADRYIPLPKTLTDPFFRGCAQLLQTYNMVLNERDRGQIIQSLASMPTSDLRVAAVEHIARRWGTVFTYDLPLSVSEWAFLQHHFPAAAVLRVSRELMSQGAA